jgi:putative methionine-R-sulfoxide reductase with GAF domain
MTKELHIDRFLFNVELNFSPIIDIWKQSSKSTNPLKAKASAELMQALYNFPKVLSGSVSKGSVEKYKNEIEFLMMAVLSRYDMDNKLISASFPYHFEYIYRSKKLNEMLENDPDLILKKFLMCSDSNFYGMNVHAYGEIFKKFYGLNADFNVPDLVFDRKCEKTKVIKYFGMSLINEFVKVEPTKKLIKLDDEKLNSIVSKFYNLDKWMEFLPPENFKFTGLHFMQINDVTESESVSQLKNKLLEKDAITTKESMKDIASLISSLLTIKDLKLGIAVVQKENNAVVIFNGNEQTFNHQNIINCERISDSIYAQALMKQEVVVSNDIENYVDKTQIESHLLERGAKSVAVLPLVDDDLFKGVLEVASSEKGVFNNDHVVKLFHIIPSFSTAANRITNEFRNRIKAKIEEEFTAIHPSVKWKFNEIAERLLKFENNEESISRESIIFHDVYPIYGACDVKSSSEKRNLSIKQDLKFQLEKINDVLVQANEKVKLPVLDHMKYNTSNNIEKLKHNLNSGDEVRIYDFITNEIEHAFNHLKETEEELIPVIDSYFELLDKDHGIIYKRRRDFENSMQILNDEANRIIDKQEDVAQKMFPHYFEKYRTDGVEYNAYIGQSIVPNKKFNDLYLKNIRLWQLIVMADIGRRTHAIKKELPIPFETTQLILVHNQPLSIKFRDDEKKFDVDGAYNLRYEITKKRIDKAIIKGSKERLVKPGTIAIIYSQPEDRNEYNKYIDYLISIKQFNGEAEYYDLEEMQGLSGLKAIRVTVNLMQHETEKEEMDELIKKVKDILAV